MKLQRLRTTSASSWIMARDIEPMAFLLAFIEIALGISILLWHPPPFSASFELLRRAGVPVSDFTYGVFLVATGLLKFYAEVWYRHRLRSLSALVNCSAFAAYSVLLWIATYKLHLVPSPMLTLSPVFGFGCLWLFVRFKHGVAFEAVSAEDEAVADHQVQRITKQIEGKGQGEARD